MKETADILNIAKRTVAFHKYRIMEEFSLKSNADLVQFAVGKSIAQRKWDNTENYG